MLDDAFNRHAVHHVYVRHGSPRRQIHGQPRTGTYSSQNRRQKHFGHRIQVPATTTQRRPSQITSRTMDALYNRHSTPDPPAVGHMEPPEEAQDRPPTMRHKFRPGPSLPRCGSLQHSARKRLKAFVGYMYYATLWPAHIAVDWRGCYCKAAHVVDCPDLGIRRAGSRGVGALVPGNPAFRRPECLVMRRECDCDGGR
jgi:hypothetical protein